jgi:hypothetical protein
MTKPFVHLFNCETKEEVIREMTDEEYAEYLITAEKIKSLSIEN